MPSAEPDDDPRRTRLARIVLPLLPRLRAFVGRLAGRAAQRHESCDDLVQSTCRELLQQQTRLLALDAEGARRWLYATAQRKIVARGRYWRASKRTARGPGAAAVAATEAVSQEASPSEWAQAREALADVERALSALPADWREAIVMSRVLGLSNAEIAARLRRSQVAVETLLSRALARLVLLLGDRHEYRIAAARRSTTDGG